MPCCFCHKSSSSSSSSSSSFKNIRVVHLNGFVEEFEHALAVTEVTGKPPKHFMFTHAQLLSAGLDHLKPDTILQPGQLYFLLPCSMFRTGVSHVELINVARKLSAVAKKSQSVSKAKERRKVSSNVHGRREKQSSSSASSSTNKFSGKRGMLRDEINVVAYINQSISSRLRSWKPTLDTIRERSFNRRSESDVQEKDLEKQRSSDGKVHS